MTPVELTNLYALAKKVQRSGNFMRMDPATILALLDEVERLGDTEKALRVTIRELEDENTELNNELGTAVQVLKLERDRLTAEVERLQVSVDSYEHRINWDTTCERCANLLDQLYASDKELDTIRARLAAVEAVAADHMTGPISGTVMDWVPLDELRAALAEPTSNEPQSAPKFDAPGPDPEGGLDLTDEEFAAFLKAAKG